MSNRVRTFFYCFKCQNQGFCDRDIITKKREELLTKWRNSNLIIKTFTSKPIDRLFDMEQELLDRCKDNLSKRK
jgi:hypothetical protein